MNDENSPVVRIIEAEFEWSQRNNKTFRFHKVDLEIQALTAKAELKARQEEIAKITEYTDEMVDQPLIYYIANRVKEFEAQTTPKENKE